MATHNQFQVARTSAFEVRGFSLVWRAQVCGLSLVIT